MLKALYLAAVGFAILPLVASHAFAEDESEKDLKKMAGDWVVVSMQLKGQEQPQAVKNSIRLTIKGNKYNTLAGNEKEEGTLSLDATKTPRAMDITTNKGENKGKPMPCIYELTDDELKVCYGLNGAGRPADFKTADGDKVILMITYKRAPKGKR